MKTMTRRIACGAIAFGAAMLAVPQAYAQAFPSKPIQIVVPYAPGGSSDFAARNLAHRLEAVLGQTVVVVNKPGASGAIGVMSVARAAPDGYTLLLGLNTEMVIIPQVSKNVSYRLDQFAPIAIVGSTPLVLVGRKSFQSNDLRSLLDEIRAKPGNYSFGGAVGSPAHISGEWLRRATGIDIVHVPYKGGAQAANDVAGDNLDLYFSGILPAKSLIESGRIKAYGVSSATRSATLPGVPTFAEAGIPDFVLGNWTALLAPQGTPEGVLTVLKRHVADILADKGFRDAMQREGIEIPANDDPAAFLKAEYDKFGRLLSTLKISQ